MKNLILCTLLLLSTTLLGQQTGSPLNVDEYVAIKLLNGKKVNGQVVEINGDTYLLKTEIGEVTILKSDIKKIRKADTLEELKKQQYNAYADSYFILPSARPVGKGNSYYKNYNLFYNQFSFGVSDNFSVSTGFESYSFFVGEAPKIFFLAPKFSFGSDMSYFSVGTTLFAGLSDDETEFIGLAYANYTYGSEYKNITVGASFGYADGGTSPVIFNINGQYPVSNKVSLVTEILFGNFDGVVVDLGLRIKTSGGIAFDAGFVTVSGASGALPILGITVPF